MLVTVTELQNYMDIRFSNRQEQAAEYVLEGLQSELESFLNRPVEVQEFTDIYTMPNNHMGVPLTSFLYDYDDAGDDGATREIGNLAAPPPTIYLEHSPVVSVESVIINRPNDPSVNEEQEEHQDYVVRKYGIDLYTAYANDKVTIEYTAGLDGSSIKAFKLLMLRAATREMQNMHDDVVGIKDLETRNVAPLDTGFLERELMSIKKWRRVRI